MITEVQARKIVTMLQLHWPNHPFTPESWQSWHMALDDVEYADVEVALKKAMKTETFCPVPAVIRNLIGANDDGMGDAEVEWGNVLSEIRRVHVYHAPVFANPATDAATRAMGWEGLCLMEQDDVIANRAHFFRIYAAHAKQIKQRRLHEIASGVTPIGSGSPKEIAS